MNVGTRDRDDDLLVWLTNRVKPEDYVVLKFDVDEGTLHSTIEWGFLADLYHHPALHLVDELYIELHFQWATAQKKGIRGPRNSNNLTSAPALTAWNYDWFHEDHTMSQAFDVLREMRRCGIAVHAWP